MNPKTKATPSLDVVVATLINRLPVEINLAKHEAPDGSAHKLRAVVKVCGRALVELENAVLWQYEQPLAASASHATGRAIYADMLRHFDPLVSACTDLIRYETAQVRGLDSLPFVLGMFETKRLSVLAAIHLQVIGGLLPVPVLEPGADHRRTACQQLSKKWRTAGLRPITDSSNLAYSSFHQFLRPLV